MKQLSDKLKSLYKETLPESNISTKTNMQKILKLFGYNNSYNNVFLKRCIKKNNAMIDIHKFKSLLDSKCGFVMCIEHENNNLVTTASLYKIKKPVYETLTNKNFNIKNINDVWGILQSMDPTSEIVLHYD